MLVYKWQQSFSCGSCGNIRKHGNLHRWTLFLINVFSRPSFLKCYVNIWWKNKPPPPSFAFLGDVLSFYIMNKKSTSANPFPFLQVPFTFLFWISTFEILHVQNWNFVISCSLIIFSNAFHHNSELITAKTKFTCLKWYESGKTSIENKRLNSGIAQKWGVTPARIFWSLFWPSNSP